MANDRDAVLQQGKTILIIEDEAALVAALSYNLRREGYGVASAGDGPEGLRLARSARPPGARASPAPPGGDGAGCGAAGCGGTGRPPSGSARPSGEQRRPRVGPQ